MVHVTHVCLRDNHVVFEKIREFRVHFFLIFVHNTCVSRVIYDHTSYRRCMYVTPQHMCTCTCMYVVHMTHGCI